MDFIVSKLASVPVKQVRVNTWNPKLKDTDEYKRVKRSLELYGLRLPIIVRENNGFEIIDGEQRFTAWVELGNQDVLIYNEGKITDKEAKALTIAYQQQVPFDEVELAHLIAELDTNLLPYDDKTLKDLLEIANFDWEKLDPAAMPDDDGVRTLSVKMNEGQLAIVQQAMEQVKEQNEDASDARCLELICADFLAGVDK